jgi:hypothetical protein
MADVEAKIQRATDALLSDEGDAPAALLKRLRDMETQLTLERREVEVIENQLAVLNSTDAPAAADAWAGLVKGVEALDYDARMKARQLVADTFSRIVISMSGFTPERDEGLIGLTLIAKRGSTRMLHISRKTGDWHAAQEIDLDGFADRELPMPR